jgi:endoglucanase
VNKDLLRELTEAPGVPGQEDAIRAIVRRELEPLCELTTDAMGNLICHKRANRGEGTPRKVMLAAHMDEIGFIVKFIDKEGFVRIQPLGGFDVRQLFSQRVRVHTREGVLLGTLNYSSKPKHMLKPEEANAAPVLDSLFVDLGLAGDTVREKVRLGDMVTLHREFQQTGDLFSAKSMDDRVAVFTMIEALKAVGEHEVDVVAVATVQEEIGLRGATASGWSVQPDVCIAIDITLANDIPGIAEQDQITKLGAGTAIKIMDGSLLCHPKLVAHFRDLAEQHGIAHQMEVLPMGGTDAGGVQRLHGGIPAFTLSIPTRYVHTVNETVHPADVQASITLLARYLEDAHTGDYGF